MCHWVQLKDIAYHIHICKLLGRFRLCTRQILCNILQYSDNRITIKYEHMLRLWQPLQARQIYVT